MSARNDGGPAFPTVPENLSSCGMSLRDYFAIHTQVDPMLVAHALIAQGKANASPDDIAKCEAIIRYNKADAMLAAREA